MFQRAGLACRTERPRTGESIRPTLGMQNVNEVADDDGNTAVEVAEKDAAAKEGIDSWHAPTRIMPYHLTCISWMHLHCS